MRLEMADERRDVTRTGTVPTVGWVWVFFAVTLLVSGAIVGLIGGVLDNPDATILAVLVPSLAAIVLTSITDGWSGVRSLLRPGGSEPTSIVLLLGAALAVPVVGLIAIAIGGAVTGDSFDFAMPSDGLVVLIPLLVIAVGEEYGWRGYALPGLQTRYLALIAALVVGAVHWIWHFPASLIDTGVPLDTPFWLFGAWVLALGVIAAALYNQSSGSVGLVIVLHFAANATFVFLPLLPENRGGELTTFSIFVGLSVLAAAMITVVAGPTTLTRARSGRARA